MPTEIDYDATINPNSGTLDIVNVNNMRPQDRNTLLHLLLWLCSDTQGRAFLAEWKLQNGHTEDEIRGALSAEFQSRLNITNAETKAAVVSSLIDGHLAADAFVKAKDAGNTTEAARQQAQYLKCMSLVMWQLNEDVSGHEFSLLW